MSKKSNSNRNYFPHEYTAKDDPKCERLIFEMGMEGYGIFWALLEVLRAQPDYTYPLANIPLAAYKYRTDPEKCAALYSILDYLLLSRIKYSFPMG